MGMGWEATNIGSIARRRKSEQMTLRVKPFISASPHYPEVHAPTLLTLCLLQPSFSPHCSSRLSPPEEGSISLWTKQRKILLALRKSDNFPHHHLLVFMLTWLKNVSILLSQLLFLLLRLKYIRKATEEGRVYSGSNFRILGWSIVMRG